MYLDLTLGRAGHASKILGRLPVGSRFVGVDRDEEALASSKERLKDFAKVEKHYVHSAFAESFASIQRLGIRSADFILMDIGVSSPQFDDPARGFSYRFDGPLDMRMDQEGTVTAESILATYSEKELTRMFRQNAQCDYAPLVSRKIVEKRREGKIETTLQLVDLIKEALPKKELLKKGHPAKQFFLALRYEVNGELEELRKGLREALSFLNPKGRLVVISFNFEEDKIVKDCFREQTNPPHVDKYLPEERREAAFIALTRKPIVPTPEEIERNSRSKSAILRAIERR